MQTRLRALFHFKIARSRRWIAGRDWLVPESVQARVACAILLAAGCAGRASDTATDGAGPARLEASGVAPTNQATSPPLSVPESAAEPADRSPLDGDVTPGDLFPGVGGVAAGPSELEPGGGTSRPPSPPAYGNADATPGDAGAPPVPASDEPYCNYDAAICKLCMEDQCGNDQAACERGNDAACASVTDCRNWMCNGVCIEARDDGYECGGFVTSTWRPTDAGQKDRIPPPSDDPYCHYDTELCDDCLAEECPGALAQCELAGDTGCRRPCDTGAEPICSFADCRNWSCSAVCVDARQDGYFCEKPVVIQTWRPDNASQ